MAADEQTVIVTPEEQSLRERAWVRFMKSAMHMRPVRWGLGALSLTHTLLLALLLLIEQLRWLPPLWPLPVTRALFSVFLATALVNAVLFGGAGIASAFYLYRRRGVDARADGTTILRRAFVIPATYVLCIFWSWAWLTGRSPRLFGAALIALYAIHQIVLIVYYTVRAFRRRTAETAESGSPSQAPTQRARLIRSMQARLTKRAEQMRYALRRNWWLLTHPNYVKKMAPPNRALFESVARGVTQNVEVLLRRGADPNLKLSFGVPLIVFCTGLGRTEAVRLLLDADGDIAVASPSTGLTALHSAADQGHLALVCLLVERGANLEARLKSGATPLMLASRKGHGSTIQFLLTRGAQVDSRTRSGTTALIFAAMYGHLEAVKILVDNGADASIKTKQGLAALDYARRRKHVNVAELLEAYQPQAVTGSGGDR